MKATLLTRFSVAAVCSVALASYALAGGHGHGHHHGHGGMSPPTMMPGDGMMGMGGMNQSERAFFTNDANASVRKNSSAPAPKH